MSSEILDKAGELLMTQVRDKAIDDWEKLISGQMKGARAERVRQQLAEFTPSQRDVILKLIPQVVDTTLHNFLWMLEQDQSLDLMAQEDDEGFQSVRDSSDGLSGELYSDRGWISRFSSKAKNPL